MGEQLSSQDAKDIEIKSGAQGEGDVPSEEREKHLEATDNGGVAPDRGKGDPNGETPGQQDGKLARGSSHTAGGPPKDASIGRSSNGNNQGNQRVFDERKSKLRSLFGCLSTSRSSVKR